MASGSILHVNAVGLMAAIEEGLDGSLRGRPFVVANEGAPRALVLDLSPEAHREGLRRGMALREARLLCPGLEARPPRPELRDLADERLARAALEFSPLVERAGAGHLFVDLAGTGRLFGPPEDAAQRLRARMAEETGLRPCLALASNKTVSKVATRVFRPGGFVALSAGEESLLLGRQPVGLLPGVGPVLRSRLLLLGIDEIGELAGLSRPEALALGPKGPELAARARGLDASPVDPEPLGRRVLRGEALLEPDTSDPEVLRLRLGALAAELGFSLRAGGSGAARALVSLVYADGERGSGSARAPGQRTRDDELLALALAALARARTRRVRVRRLCLELSELAPAGPELDLFEPEDSRLARLQPALDRIRGKYGARALSPGALLALGAGA